MTLTQHLVDLGYECLALLDTDKPVSPQSVAKARAAGAIILEWPDKCSPEERIFLDVPWEVVRALVEYAVDCRSKDSVLTITNALCLKNDVVELTDLTLPNSLDSLALRAVLGLAAKEKDKEWFKTIDRGEHMATLIHPCLDQIATKPFAEYLGRIRAWVDG